MRTGFSRTTLFFPLILLSGDRDREYEDLLPKLPLFLSGDREKLLLRSGDLDRLIRSLLLSGDLDQEEVLLSSRP